MNKKAEGPSFIVVGLILAIVILALSIPFLVKMYNKAKQVTDSPCGGLTTQKGVCKPSCDDNELVAAIGTVEEPAFGCPPKEEGKEKQIYWCVPT